MAYVKSYSNYILRSKHQNVNDGTVYERDYTTIGGVGNFTKDQTPIYQTGNFLMTVGTDKVNVKPYAEKDWEKNEDGEIWTYKNVKNASGVTEYNDHKIVLKEDYYSLLDFAYYGSCSELVRTSLTDAMSRFPGELFVTNIPYSSDTETIIYADGDLLQIDNPFSIDLVTQHVTESADLNELKYLIANGWFKNYEIIHDGIVSSITNYQIIPFTFADEEDVCTIDCDNHTVIPSPYSKVCNAYELILNDELHIFNFVGKKKVTSLTSTQFEKWHIRPKESFLTDFYNSLDRFQAVILNPHTEPQYKAVFEVYEESDRGFDKHLETFVFPKGYGGYNIGSIAIAYQNYVNKFLKYTTVIDDNFSDSMYRMMTHESLKNFDKTHSDDFIEGGEKLAKLIRLFGREFDEIKFYIDNISNYNQITYDDLENMPDYFLSDNLGTNGWDVLNIYPLTLTEGIYVDGKFVELDVITGKTAFDNEHVRIFNQNISDSIKPYSSDRLGEHKYGYFNVCGDGQYDEVLNTELTKDRKFYVDDSNGKNIVRKKIKKYSSEKEFSYKDINTIFLKRLALNSKAIAKKKGTVQGIESMLSMFGLKSKKYAELTNSDVYDYEITEYTTFTNGIDDLPYNCKGMNHINWYNKTKTVPYNTSDYKQGIYVDYQGLPIAFRKMPNGVNRLYPYFNSENAIDGNLYYQMNGGWMHDTSLYTYDNSNNLIENSDVFKETLNSIKNVKTISNLLGQSMNDINDCQVCHVNSLDGKYMVIDGLLYDVLTDRNNKEYINVTVKNASVTVGTHVFYYNIYVSTPYENCSTLSDEMQLKGYNVSTLKNGTNIKIYLDGDHIEALDASTYEESIDFVSTDEQVYVTDGIFVVDKVEGTEYSNYFKLTNKNNKDKVDFGGWEQIAKNSKEYYQLNSIINYYKGNNPHNGNMNYDKGFAYVDYFANLFNYSLNNDLFDDRQYKGSFDSERHKIEQIGFKNIVTDESEKKYPLYEDDKIHFFGNWFDVNDGSVNEYNVEDHDSWYDKETYYNAVSNVVKNKQTVDGVCNGSDVDGSTYQIVNTKVISLTFKMLNMALAKDNMEEVKYFKSVVLPWVAQMIPSNCIFDVKFDMSNCIVDTEIETHSMCELSTKINTCGIHTVIAQEPMPLCALDTDIESDYVCTMSVDENQEEFGVYPKIMNMTLSNSSTTINLNVSGLTDYTYTIEYGVSDGCDINSGSKYIPSSYLSLSGINNNTAVSFNDDITSPSQCLWKTKNDNGNVLKQFNGNTSLVLDIEENPTILTITSLLKITYYRNGVKVGSETITFKQIPSKNYFRGLTYESDNTVSANITSWGDVIVQLNMDSHLSNTLEIHGNLNEECVENLEEIYLALLHEAQSMGSLEITKPNDTTIYVKNTDQITTRDIICTVGVQTFDISFIRNN